MKVTTYHTPFRAITYCLVTSEAEHKQACKRLGFKSAGYLSCGSDAQSEMDGNNVLVHVSDLSRCPDVEVYALLAHEAVHVWQFLCEAILEHQPSPEFEAYTIQEITLNLCSEYKKRFYT